MIWLKPAAAWLLFSFAAVNLTAQAIAVGLILAGLAQPNPERGAAFVVMGLFAPLALAGWYRWKDAP